MLFVSRVVRPAANANRSADAPPEVVMNKFKITLEGTGHRPQVLTEKDKNIRAIVDAWLYMFEEANAAEQSVQSGLLHCGHPKSSLVRLRFGSLPYCEDCKRATTQNVSPP